MYTIGVFILPIVDKAVNIYCYGEKTIVQRTYVNYGNYVHAWNL